MENKETLTLGKGRRGTGIVGWVHQQLSSEHWGWVQGPGWASSPDGFLGRPGPADALQERKWVPDKT